MLTVPEVKSSANTPPINASGRLIKTIADKVRSLNSPYKSKKITTIARIDVISSVRDAFEDRKSTRLNSSH